MDVSTAPHSHLGSFNDFSFTDVSKVSPTEPASFNFTVWNVFFCFLFFCQTPAINYLNWGFTRCATSPTSTILFPSPVVIAVNTLINTQTQRRGAGGSLPRKWTSLVELGLHWRRFLVVMVTTAYSELTNLTLKICSETGNPVCDDVSLLNLLSETSPTTSNKE